MEEAQWNRKKRPQPVCRVQKADNGAEYITFPGLDAISRIRHLCTTRQGGVSTGMFRSMNLSYVRGDAAENVDENFRRAAHWLGYRAEDIVCTDQTHTVNIRTVTSQDKGKGVTRQRDFSDIDGLITNEPGIVLAGFYADCVPLLFADPVSGVAGIAHSGWRGTVGEIGRHMVERMQQEFGADPENMQAAIGPSICQDCYEVSEDVIQEIKSRFEEALWPLFFREKHDPGEKAQVTAQSTAEAENATGKKKYELDLWEMNRQILMHAGIPEEKIEVTDLCTCCNPELLFSHRASHGKRGNLGAFICLV